MAPIILVGKTFMVHIKSTKTMKVFFHVALVVYGSSVNLIEIAPVVSYRDMMG